jgi:cyanophycinase-like exopeptidase
MKKYLLLFILSTPVFSQGYTSYFTGNTTNISTITTPGICLMGGATESDNAMKWMLQRANGGDVLVLRCSGSNGYNNYLYSGLGINVNSVETLVISSIAGATNAYVLDKVANAEMIWFAGGDQSLYVNYFKNNALEDLLNNHINVKNAPIGGTSAGMAILGGKYFSALNGSVTSAQALANPYNSLVTIGLNDFLNVPFMQNVTTDTHFNNPDRKGRLMSFMAKNATEQNIRTYGIASNEYVAVCIDDSGKAIVFGDYPNYQEFAYFAQANCQSNFLPEICVANSSLTWNRNGEAVKVYKVPGTINGTNYFQLSDWQSGSGGSWENWSVSNGVFSSNIGNQSTCSLGLNDFLFEKITISPVPFFDNISIENLENANIKIVDFIGKKVFENFFEKKAIINTTEFSDGFYTISIEQNGRIINKKVIKKPF